MSTPKTWAANTEPTPEQLAVWLQDATHEERVQHASKVLDLSARAHDCLTRNHEGLLEERNHWIGEAHRFKRLYQASDKDATRWFKRMKVAEAALDAASADLTAQQDHDGTDAARGKELLCERCGCTRWSCLTKFNGGCCGTCDHPTTDPEETR